MSTIAIIGSGNVGRAIAESAVRAGHEVVIASRDPGHASAAAAASGARSASSPAVAVAGADIVILAVPAQAHAEVAAAVGGLLEGRIVVDTSNKPTPNLEDLDADPTSTAERLQRLLPDARVVKAFNTAFAARMTDPTVDGVETDGFVSADEIGAREAVLALVGDLGFHPVDAGPLANARALEALAWLNIYLNMTHGGSWQGGWKLVEPDAIAA
jgi:hypothetical protein